jgi:two-component system, OmpR family, phosphate regulon sensor histidine kinase PhoR
VVAVDKHRLVRLANKAMTPLLNRPPQETIGRPLWEVLRHREVGDLLDRALGGSDEETREVIFPLPTETIWRVQARPLGEGAVITFTDLTPLKRLESLRKDFVANVSHELKTPLTSLRASLETLLDGALEDPAYAREFLETAQAQVERLQRLIEDLLTLSRLERSETPQPGRASLHETVRRALGAIRPLAEKAGVILEEDLPGAPVDLAISEDELTQVLLNLLDNAVKFNKPGGRVKVSGRRAAGTMELDIQDNGLGIPAEDQPRIFERFYRVAKARSGDAGGTGLGLSIVKHIIERRAGSVRLESTPGRGSTFFVSIPLA